METITESQITNALLSYNVPRDTISVFLDYHRENSLLWTAFEEKALEIISLGKKHYGARAVIEIVRYERLRLGASDGFKINDNFIAYYARIFEFLHPQYNGFFQMRKIKGLSSKSAKMLAGMSHLKLNI
jgi:hypothetical protein